MIYDDAIYRMGFMMKYNGMMWDIQPYKSIDGFIYMDLPSGKLA